MPGNEVGDRIHNFFAQENLSQGQHHQEVVDGTWTGLGNNSWAGSQRQTGTTYISNLKNQSGQQSGDSERGYGGPSAAVFNGMNFSHQFARSQPQSQQAIANGYMQGNQVFQTSENDTSLLGVDTDNDRRNLTSRGFSILDAQVGSGPEIYKKNSLRMDFNDAPVNYDFLGGQQQHTSNHHPSMFQSLPRQQSGISDMHLLQQQIMLNQMQEMQRQQQHQKQQESRQFNSSNQVSGFAKQALAGHPSAMVNGVPIHDASSYSWHPELMPTNSNWSQQVASPSMQGSSSGLIFSPEQGQAPRFMGMVPHQVDRSLHGVPISGSRNSPNQYSPIQIDNHTMQQMSASSNHYARFPDNADLHDGTSVARQGYQGKKSMGFGDTQDLNVGFNLENLQQVDSQQSNGPSQDLLRRQDLHVSSDTSQEKTAMEVAPSHNVATLDPTEEKILFCSDDNLWDAFGRSANVSSGGSVVDGDVFGSFPSMQSGSWSALMQSAVAETSSADTKDFFGTKESKTNSFHNVGLSNSTSGVRENAGLEASDSLTLSGANVKPSNVVRKPTGIRKFQYHPMGDLDVDVEHSYTHARSTLTQAPGLKGQDHGGISQPKFPAQTARNSMEFDKGCFPGFQGDEKGLDETALKNIVSGSAPSTSTSFDRNAHHYATGRTTQPSQNMLELLHKVDQSGEHGSATNFSSSDFNQLSEMHGINNCNGSINLHQNQSSTSQGFGLQLAPNSVPIQQQSFISQQSRAQYNVFKSNNDSETSSRPHKLEAHSVQLLGNAPPETGSSFASVHGSAGKEHPAKGDLSQRVSPENEAFVRSLKPNNFSHQNETGSSFASLHGSAGKENPAKGDLSQHVSPENEAFGRSLKPNNFSHQNYSMHQVQGMRTAEVDPSNRSSKRFKGPDSSIDVQEGGQQQLRDHNSMARDASTAHGANVQDTNTFSQDVVTFGKKDLQNFSNSSVVSVRAEHSKISPQMAPSWFDQYGTFKNGQISPLPDAQKFASMKTMDLPFNVTRPSSSLCAPTPVEQDISPLPDAQRISSMNTMDLPFKVTRPSSSLCAPTPVEQGNAVGLDADLHGLLPKSFTPSSVASDNLSSQVTNLGVADVSLTIIRPKKRKTATSELVPWHKQVVHGLRMLQNISSAESDWAHAANRLTETVEDEVDITDDGPPVYRSKRRLVITTQLMQLLLNPPARSVLTADAMSNYESVVHFLVRSTVGDACSTLSCAGGDTPAPSSSGNILPEKLKNPERISDQYFSKVVEDLISRATKLENDILRLDKRASVLDLRVECQELEKYSVINRFAKFHGRAQVDTAEMSSPDAPKNAQKSCLQRYVTAIPMPKNLPDRVQCFSL
ncbi:dentin sialophosphoprotein-related [Euphorbia peplus]|nr:dentin sialophosphoprotein-related [Euphorbia peplus]